MAWWDLLRTDTGKWAGTEWNPTPGKGQRNDYSVPMPVGTPVVAPVSGIVLDNHTSGGGYYSYYGRQVWGGEVDILTSLPDYPGGMQDVNLLHLDTINVKPGDTVTAGQTVLGTSGGQNKGGNMPSSPIYSSGPHLGVGVHSVPSWDTMYNPHTLLANLLNGRDNSSVPTQAQLQGSGLGGIARGGVPQGIPLAAGAPSGYGRHSDQTTPSAQAPYHTSDPLGAIGDFFGRINNFLLDPTRGLKILIGSVLVFAGLTLFLFSTLGASAAPEIGEAATRAIGVPEAAPSVRSALQRHTITGGVRSAVQARAALQGQKTLQRRQEAGEAIGRAHGFNVGQQEGRKVGMEQGREEYHQEFVEAGRRGGQATAAKRQAEKDAREASRLEEEQAREAEMQELLDLGREARAKQQGSQQSGLNWFQQKGGALDDVMRQIRGPQPPEEQ